MNVYRRLVCTCAMQELRGVESPTLCGATTLWRMTLSTANPFAQRSNLPFEMPPFADIRDDHYLPAFEAGCAEQLAEVEAILATPGEPTFENTIVALERSGQLLARVLNVFFNKTSSDTSDALDAIDAEISPKLSAHSDAIHLNPDLFARISELHARAHDLGLTAEDARLVQKYYDDFVNAGAHLDASDRERLTALNEELSALSTQFGKQLLADTNDLAVLVEDVADLDGLTEGEIAAAAAAAEARDLAGKWLITAVNFSGHPVLSSLRNRELRQRIMEASLLKGNRDNDHDTKATLLQMIRLRAQRAELFGMSSHAEYVISQQTAGNPENVEAMMRRIAPAAVANARKEADALQASASRDGITLESWDWQYYAEQVRVAEYNVDRAAMRPYFELERVLRDGVFYAAGKLYGLTFTERDDIVSYHPEARVFEVRDEDSKPVGLYIGDFYTRDSKRGGAWMNSLVDQNKLLGQLPVVVNNLNISKPSAGTATLLTFDETTTLFHEFGHALHGLLSNVTYPRLSGTSVERDFVEFPSQVNEMWMLWPDVVQNYARHHETGEALPQEWIDAIDASSTFNEGHTTTSYLAAAVLDLAWHSLSQQNVPGDVNAFERDAIDAYGLLLEQVPTRYRSTYFAHIYAGGYSAGYYGYIWSEVLDADTVAWFKENGGLTRENGEHFKRTLLSRGGSIDSMQMYREFRGRDAAIERRGLLG